MELIPSEQRDELITTFVKRDAFHLELKDAYATAVEEGPFAKWIKGEPDDFAWLKPWQNRIRDATQVGKTVRRVRVISEPITDYVKWEHSNTILNLEAGEDIRWLPRHLLPGEISFPVDGNDWWLLMIGWLPSGTSMRMAASRDTKLSLTALSLPTASEFAISCGASPSLTASTGRPEFTQCPIKPGRHEKHSALACAISVRMPGSPAEHWPT